MSLLNTASPWTTDENSKKRQSTMRKTIKLKPSSAEDLDITPVDTPPSIEQTQVHMEERSSRVNNLLDQITASNDNDANKMGVFVPISNPNINVKKEEKDDLTISRLHPPVQVLSQMNRQKIGNFLANDNSAVYSNYMSSYEKPAMFKKENPDSVARPINDNKVMDKINYMIHLLEEQQHEKTNNITEEFILYTFLGVFIIFVVDSFSRSGKYTR
uniref:Uncharacterized protein n=1 Tax=viral metagenome TaxID=1070528 RepID=A0A6C0B8K8_9ZZZZ